jgi:hypothetical protein
LTYCNILVGGAMEPPAHPHAGGSADTKLACALIPHSAKSMDCQTRLVDGTRVIASTAISFND